MWGGTRTLSFEQANLAGTRFDNATIEAFDVVNLVSSTMKLSSLGGARVLTLGGASNLSITGSVEGLAFVQMDVDCSLTLGCIPQLDDEAFIIAVKGDITLLGNQSITLTEVTYANGDVLNNVYFRSEDGQLYEATVAWLDQQSSLRNLAVGKVIPEPSTAVLSLLALAGLVARRRRA